MIAVIDYRAGNLTSVKLALDTLEVEALVTPDPDAILKAERVIFPGVGAARAAMSSLAELGLIDVINQVVRKNKPFMGICLGTQIILQESEENEGTSCIGLIEGRVQLFKPSNPYDKIPQMGWNNVAIRKPHPVMDGIRDGSEFYFVHSYYPVPASNELIIGTTDYADTEFASVIGRDNIIATQFHPEKSGKVGLKLLNNFVHWNP